MMRLSLPIKALAAWIVFAIHGMYPEAQAVIVAGANGDGLNNATENGLQTFLSNSSLPAFPYWDNLIRVTDSSGVYLGHNASTGQGWVLTAGHVTYPELNDPLNGITVDGVMYPVRAQHSVGSADLALYAIGGNVGDPALPALPAIPIFTGTVAASELLIMTGRGMRDQGPPEDTTPPYSWGTPFFSDANPIRWGSNLVSPYNGNLFTNAGSTVAFSSDFDNPAAPHNEDDTLWEGQLSVGDSGGGSFVLRDGAWLLAGIGITVTAQVASSASYGDFSFMANLSTYRSSISNVTSTLVPEPGAALLALTGAAGWFLLGHRRKVLREKSALSD